MAYANQIDGKDRRLFTIEARYLLIILILVLISSVAGLAARASLLLAAGAAVTIAHSVASPVEASARLHSRLAEVRVAALHATVAGGGLGLNGGHGGGRHNHGGDEGHGNDNGGAGSHCGFNEKVCGVGYWAI